MYFHFRSLGYVPIHFKEIAINTFWRIKNKIAFSCKTYFVLFTTAKNPISHCTKKTVTCLFQLKWRMPERMEDIQRCILYPPHIVNTYVCTYMQSCQFLWASDNNADSQKKNPSQQHIGECLMTLFDVICPVKRSNKLKQWKITLKAILYESSELVCGWELHISITEEI